MRDLTGQIENWQFCDGTPYYQDDIPQLLIPQGWGPLRYLDNAPIPGTEPPKTAYRPECLPVSIWDIGGGAEKFGQSPPNPSEYNTIFKIHKGMAPFYYELPQIVQYAFQAGHKYIFRAWVFMDFYDADGTLMDDPYGSEAGIALDGDIHWSGPLPMDQWSALEVEWTPEQDTEQVEIALCGKAQWGMAGNTFWWHGLRMYEDEDGPAPPSPPASGVVEIGPESRAFVVAQVGRIIEALGNFDPGVPAPPSEEPALWNEDLRAALPRNDSCPSPLQGGWWRRTLSQITGITLHHTISVDPLATARAYLQKGGGRPSIPYHFWVHRDGHISYCLNLTEGCWHDHTGHENRHVSVGLAGVLDENPPPQVQLQAAIRLVQGLMEMLGIAVAGVKGHRDFVATRCPGWGAPPHYLDWRAEFYAGLVDLPQPAPPSAPTLIGLNDESGDGGQTGAYWMMENGLRGLIVRPLYIGTHAQMLDFSVEKDAGLRVIVNLRYSFARDNGGQGTLPLPGTPAWSLFVEAAAQTMITSKGVWGWEIGNEANNPREFPVAGALTPEMVAGTYNAIRGRVWESTARPYMAPGALDPFNAQAGDPRDWLRVIWNQISGAEFITAHGYVRGPDPALVGSEARFADDPLRWQYLNYPGCVTELLKSLPGCWGSLPVYVTEFNHLWKTVEGDWGWMDDERAAEIVRRAYQAAQGEDFAGVALYRWAGDAWQVQHNQAVLGTVAEILA